MEYGMGMVQDTGQTCTVLLRLFYLMVYGHNSYGHNHIQYGGHPHFGWLDLLNRPTVGKRTGHGHGIHL